MELSGIKPTFPVLLHDGIALSGEDTADPPVERDANGVPLEWTLLKIGDNPMVQSGQSCNLKLDSEDMASILSYYTKKGELIPVDSNHYLHELANRKGLDEVELLRMLPSGVAAMGYGSLALSGEDLRFRVKWTPLAYELLKEKIFKYFSPAIRGFAKPPLRVTSVAMENEPAINHLDALAAGAEKRGLAPQPQKGSKMTKLDKALMKLLGRDSVALGAETDENKDKLACEVEEKATMIEQVKLLLGLKVESTIDEVIAALKAETDKAKTADDKQTQLDQLAASAESAAHARLVAQGRAERKIVESDMTYVNSLDSLALKAHLDHTSPKFPAKLADDGRKADPDTLALSAEEERTISSMRLDRAKYLELKRKGNSK